MDAGNPDCQIVEKEEKAVHICMAFFLCVGVRNGEKVSFHIPYVNIFTKLKGERIYENNN